MEVAPVASHLMNQAVILTKRASLSFQVKSDGHVPDLLQSFYTNK